MTQQNQDLAQVAVEAVATEQTPPAAPQYMTAERVQEILSQQQRSFERQIAGMTSKIDTGLNAIRRDTQSWAQQQIQVQTKAQRDAWLAGLNEEQRAVAEPLLGELDKSRQVTAPLEEQPAQQQAQDAAALWEPVYQMVEDAGLKRDNPKVDYAAFTDAGLTDRQRQQRFMASLVKAAAPVVVANAPAAPARTPAPPAPPEAPRGGGGYGTVDSVVDAFITGKLNVTEYKQKMQSFGVTV